MTSTTPWHEWEDWKAGLYLANQPREEAILLSLNLLQDCDFFLEAGREMIRNWPNASRHNVQRLWSGRRAWVGQAACCYTHTATSIETRSAWGLLHNAAQRGANQVAERLIAEYLTRGAARAETLFVD